MNWIDRIPFRRTIFVIFTLLVFFTSLIDIVAEFGEGESAGDMVDDIAMLLISSLIVVLFVSDRIAQHKALGQLQNQLDSARGQLALMDSNSPRLASQYREIMQRQFDAWALTPSEQEVVLALLKGLSFREVAQLRDTQEKTVRQQATSVYKKAGVAGRHELAAWFFEDMLEPPALK